MTEFEAKKEEIAIKIIKAIEVLCDSEYNKAACIIFDQVKLIRDLQPTKLPTCATCKHFSNYIDYKKCECGKSAKYYQEISDPQKHVCIKHSDYRDVGSL